MAWPAEDARTLLALVRSRPATLGGGRLVCLDGPAGSGKSTLAAAFAELTGSPVIPTDEMLAGWGGLADLADTVVDFLRPLAAGRPGRWRRWDWHTSGWASWHDVEPAPLLVLEGVGCWSPAIAPWVTALAWVEAPDGVRRERALDRDGDVFAPHWDQWARDEAVVFGRDRTRDHADVVIGT